MSVKKLWTPTYSHGGVQVGRWAPVVGDAVSAGRPIQVAGSHPSPSNWPILIIVLKAGTATILIEGNGGELDQNGNPPSDEWIDVSNGGYALDIVGSTKVAKRLPPIMPIYRTRISAEAGGELVSYVPCLILPSGQIISAQHPSTFNSGS